MLVTTKELLTAVLRADPSITSAQIQAMLAAVAAPRLTAPRENDRLIRRAEAARLLARTTRAVDLLARAGTLRRVRLPGRRRGAGFRLSEVMSLLQDNAHA
jgi:hypothetical protein